MNYEKELALAKQNMVHQAETIEKLESELHKVNSEHDEKITSLKQTLISESERNELKMKKEKEMI